MTKKQLQRIATGFRSGLLGRDTSEMRCFMVCAPLHGYLAVLGYETKLIEGEVDLPPGLVAQHFWLELPTGEICDCQEWLCYMETGDSMTFSSTTVNCFGWIEFPPEIGGCS